MINFSLVLARLRDRPQLECLIEDRTQWDFLSDLINLTEETSVAQLDRPSTASAEDTLPRVDEPATDAEMAAKVADLLSLPAFEIGWNVVGLDTGGVEITLPSGRVFRLAVEQLGPE